MNAMKVIAKRVSRDFATQSNEKLADRADKREKNMSFKSMRATLFQFGMKHIEHIDRYLARSERPSKVRTESSAAW